MQFYVPEDIDIKIICNKPVPHLKGARFESLSSMLRTLPSNGRCLHIHRLEIDFYATVIYDFVSKYENMPSWAPPVSF
jgi:hypothetical protein